MTDDRVPSAVVIDGVSKRYPNQSAKDAALKSTSLSIRAGALTAVMGASGSGKTTLLEILGLIRSPDKGSVRIFDGIFGADTSEDERTSFRGANIGFVFQSFALIDFLSSAENVQLPLTVAGVAAGEVTRDASAILASLGFERSDLFTKNVADLSGGEKQRVAIARAMVRHPKLVLADEPTGNLDSETSHVVMTALRRLVDEHDCTVVVITHDSDLPKVYADDLVEMKDGRVARTARVRRAAERASVEETPRVESGRPVHIHAEPAQRLSAVRIAWRLLWGVPILTWLNLSALSFGLGALLLIGSILLGIDAILGDVLRHNPRMKQIQLQSVGQGFLFDVDERKKLDDQLARAGLSDRARLVKVERGKVRISVGSISKDLDVRSAEPDDPLFPIELFQVGHPITWQQRSDGPIEAVLTADIVRRLGFEMAADAANSRLSLVVARKRDGRTETFGLDARVVGVLDDEVNVDPTAKAMLPLEVCTRLRLWQESLIGGFWDQIDSAAEVREAGYERVRFLVRRGAAQNEIEQVESALGGVKLQPLDNSEATADVTCVNLEARRDGRGEVYKACVVLGGKECTVYLCPLGSELAAAIELERFGGAGPLVVSPDLLPVVVDGTGKPRRTSLGLQLLGTAGTEGRIRTIRGTLDVDVEFGAVGLNLPPATMVVDLSKGDLRQHLDRFLSRSSTHESIVYCRVADRRTAVRLAEGLETKLGTATALVALQPIVSVVASLRERPAAVATFGPPAHRLSRRPAWLLHGSGRATGLRSTDVILTDSTAPSVLDALALPCARRRRSELPGGPIVFVSPATLRRGCQGLVIPDLRLKIPRERVLSVEFPRSWQHVRGEAIPLVVLPGRSVGPPLWGIFAATATQVEAWSRSVPVFGPRRHFAKLGAEWVLCVSPAKGERASQTLQRLRDHARRGRLPLATTGIIDCVPFGDGVRLVSNEVLGTLVAPEHRVHLVSGGRAAGTRSSEPSVLGASLGDRRVVVQATGLDLYAEPAPFRVAFVPAAWIGRARLVRDGKLDSDGRLMAEGVRPAAPSWSLRVGAFTDTTIWSSRRRTSLDVFAARAPANRLFQTHEATSARMQSTAVRTAFVEGIMRCEVVSGTRAVGGHVVGIDTNARQALGRWNVPFREVPNWSYDGRGKVPVMVGRRVAKAIGLLDDPARQVTLRVQRPAAVDYGNRMLGLPCVVAGVAMLPTDDVFVPVRALRFLRGWKKGVATWENSNLKFAAASSAARQSDGYLYLDVFAETVDDVEPVYAALRDLDSEKFAISTNLAVTRDYKRYQSLAMTLFAFVTVLTLLGSLVSITCAFWGEAVRRTRDIAVMRVVGASPRLIWMLYMLPAQFIGIGAAVVGTMFGLGLVGLCYTGLDEQLTGLDLSRLIAVPWWALFVLLAIAALFCFAGSYLPARQASRQPVADAMR